MTCPKCQGLLIDEHDETRCLNCGYRVLQVAPTPICKFHASKGRCIKTAMKHSNYCNQHDALEAHRRRQHHDADAARDD